jgi:N-glycosylase/DNA lyase
LKGCPLNLDVTLCCGQVFRWEKRREWWYGVVGSRVLKVRQDEDVLDFQNVEAGFVRHYFSLDHDLQRIGREIGKDSHVKAALKQFWGLRLIRQEPWECLISFICATYKSVAAIRQMLLRLTTRFGEKTVYEGNEFYAFPTPERLARATLQDLEGCGLGYRSKYVQETSKRIHGDKYELDTLRRMPYEQAKRELCQFPGVGSKVADCVLLFSLGRLDAFPVDVRVKRMILRNYSEHFQEVFVKRLAKEESFSSSEYERICGFGRSYFGRYAGYAQEYLYHYERTNY